MIIPRLALFQARTLRSTANPPPIIEYATSSRTSPSAQSSVSAGAATDAPVNTAMPVEDCDLAWAAGPGGVSPAPSSHYTDSEADLKADKGPNPPDGKSRVRMRLTKVEYEKAGSARSPAQERMREELMRDLGMKD